MHAWSGSLVASLLAAAAAANAPPGPRGELVELQVAGVVPLDPESGSLLVLRQKGTSTVLPIFVGRSEGLALEQRLKRGPPRRPGTVELLERAITALGGRVTRVALDGEQSALLRARVTLEQGARRLELDARPSDSVGLAVATGAPIFATRQVLAEAGITPADLARLRAGQAPSSTDSGAGSKLSF